MPSTSVTAVLAALLAGCHGDGRRNPDKADACSEPATWYRDADGDGWGDLASPTTACETPSDHVARAGDCDDSRLDVHPGASETCDGVDNDCNGLVDDDASDATVWYADADGDGWGDDAAAHASCEARVGAVAQGGDCNDDDASVHPGATDIWYDRVDQDCQGDDDFDADGDGFSSDVFGGTDCEDHEPDIHPDAPEVCGDGIDQDCNAIDPRCRIQGEIGAANAEAVLTGTGWDWYTGWSVASAPGLFGPDETSFAVASPGYSRVAQYAGAVQVWRGAPEGELLVEDAAATLVGTQEIAAFGFDLAAHVDIDGDGYSSLLVGSDYYTVGTMTGAGGAWMFHGPVTGTISEGDADWSASGDVAHNYAGEHVASVRDHPETGAGSVLLGASGDDSRGNMSGAAYLVSGPFTGALSLAEADAKLLGVSAEDKAGKAVADLGDLNGDGRGDFAVGAPGSEAGSYHGAVYVFASLVEGEIGLENADAILRGDHERDWLGSTLGAAGDLNADGYDDVMVSADHKVTSTGGAGATYLVLGPLSGTQLASDVASAALLGEDKYDEAGHSIASAGDVDADGHIDVLVGAPYHPAGGTYAGAAYLLYGPLSGTRSLSEADAKIIGDGDEEWLGYSVAGLGDLDGDGFDDLATGAPHHDAGTYQGAAYIWYGAGD